MSTTDLAVAPTRTRLLTVTGHRVQGRAARDGWPEFEIRARFEFQDDTDRQALRTEIESWIRALETMFEMGIESGDLTAVRKIRHAVALAAATRLIYFDLGALRVCEALLALDEGEGCNRETLMRHLTTHRSGASAPYFPGRESVAGVVTKLVNHDMLVVDPESRHYKLTELGREATMIYDEGGERLLRAMNLLPEARP
jgi:hypothetical protein